MRRHCALATALFVGSLLLPARAEIPRPRVSGPLAVDPGSYPFGGAAHTRVPTDLAASGYVEEEFLLSGTANVYEWPVSGPAVVRSTGAEYTTRVLIRRPAVRARFSGTAIVEMLNPSNSFDLNIGWALSHKQMVRAGDAWVGVTAKPVAARSLMTFNPVRYQRLAWPNPLATDDPRNCPEVARDSERSTENGLVWDMHRQLGAWLRSDDRSNPLGYGARRSPVRHLIAWGYSQTGAFLYTYVNALHPLDVRERGRPLFDGYLIAVASGPAPIHQCAPLLAPDDPRRVLQPAGVPVIRVMSQSDFLTGIRARMADSDTLPALTRNYEIAGAAHATPDELNFAAAPADIAHAGRMVPPMACNEGPRSRFPNSVAFNAVLDNLQRWIRTGTAPPRAAPIAVTDGKPVLDAHGNVVGGVRSPYVDVPTSTWHANATGESFCRIAGYEVPFDPTTLAALYPSKEAWVRKVAANVAALVQARFITREDGRDVVEEARARPWPDRP